MGAAVEIPGVGEVEFPDDWSEDQVAAQSQKLYEEHSATGPLGLAPSHAQPIPPEAASIPSHAPPPAVASVLEGGAGAQAIGPDITLLDRLGARLHPMTPPAEQPPLGAGATGIGPDQTGILGRIKQAILPQPGQPAATMNAPQLVSALTEQAAMRGLPIAPVTDALAAKAVEAGSPYAAPVIQKAGELAEGVTSPAGILTGPGGAAPGPVKAAASLGFGASMLKGGVEQAKRAIKGYEAGHVSPEELGNVLGAAADLTMGAGATVHGLKTADAAAGARKRAPAVEALDTLQSAVEGLRKAIVPETAPEAPRGAPPEAPPTAQEAPPLRPEAVPAPPAEKPPVPPSGPGIVAPAQNPEAHPPRAEGVPEPSSATSPAPTPAPGPTPSPKPVSWDATPESVRAASSKGVATVRVPTAKLLELARQDIGSPGRANQEVGGTDKLTRAKEFLATNPEGVKTPEISVNGRGVVIEDGYHRMKAALDLGHTEVPVRIERSQLGRLRELGVGYTDLLDGRTMEGAKAPTTKPGQVTTESDQTAPELPPWIKTDSAAMIGTSHTTKGFKTKAALFRAIMPFRNLGQWKAFKELDGDGKTQFVGYIGKTAESKPGTFDRAAPSPPAPTVEEPPAGAPADVASKVEETKKVAAFTPDDIKSLEQRAGEPGFSENDLTPEEKAKLVTIRNLRERSLSLSQQLENRALRTPEAKHAAEREIRVIEHWIATGGDAPVKLLKNGGIKNYGELRTIDRAVNEEYKRDGGFRDEDEMRNTLEQIGVKPAPPETADVSEHENVDTSFDFGANAGEPAPPAKTETFGGQPISPEHKADLIEKAKAYDAKKAGATITDRTPEGFGPGPAPTPAEKIPGRFRPKSYVEFEKPFVGKNGTKLVGYEWHYTLEHSVDKRGEDVTRRVSDWENSTPNEKTGREVVHEFTIESHDGETHQVSLESALKEMGYLEAGQGKNAAAVKSIASSLKSRAKLKMEREALAPEVFKSDEARAKAESEVATMTPPEITSEPTGEGRSQVFRMGDAKVWQHTPGEITPERRSTLELAWRDRRMFELGGVDTSGKKTQLEYLDKRIAELDAKIAKKQAEAPAAPEPAPAAPEKPTSSPAREFLANENKMDRNRKLALFDKPRSFDGKPTKLGPELERRVAEGWTVQAVKGERRFTGPDGRFLDEKAITRTGMDYADWLGKRAGTPATEEVAAAPEPAPAAPAKEIAVGKEIAERRDAGRTIKSTVSVGEDHIVVARGEFSKEKMPKPAKADAEVWSVYRKGRTDGSGRAHADELLASKLTKADAIAMAKRQESGAEPPVAVESFADRNKREWREQQDQFRKLHEPKPAEGDTAELRTPDGAPIAHIKLLSDYGRMGSTWQVEKWVGGDEPRPFGDGETWRDYWQGRIVNRLQDRDGKTTREGGDFLQMVRPADDKYIGPVVEAKPADNYAGSGEELKDALARDRKPPTALEADPRYARMQELGDQTVEAARAGKASTAALLAQKAATLRSELEADYPDEFAKRAEKLKPQTSLFGGESKAPSKSDPRLAKIADLEERANAAAKAGKTVQARAFGKKIEQLRAELEGAPPAASSSEGQSDMFGGGGGGGSMGLSPHGAAGGFGIERAMAAVKGFASPDAEVISRNSLNKRLEKIHERMASLAGKFGFKQGSMRGSLAHFEPKPETIRSQMVNDVESLSHELGHHLQKVLWPDIRTKGGGLSGKVPIFREFRKELIPLATKPRSGQAQTPEGFAEFVRLYMTDAVDAQKRAPGFFKRFEQVMQGQQPDILSMMHEFRGAYDSWVALPLNARTEAVISRASGSSRIPDWQTTKGFASHLYTLFLDSDNPIKHMVDDWTGQKGRTLPADKDPYLLARAMKAVSGRGDAFVRDGVLDFNSGGIVPGSKSLTEILAPIAKQSKEWEHYALWKRGVSLLGRYDQKGRAAGSALLRQVGADSSTVRDAITKAEADNPHFKTALDEYQAWNDGLLKYLVDAGALSADGRDAIRKANPFYVPFMRDFEAEGNTRGGTGRTFGNTPEAVRAIKGSGRQIMAPIEMMVRQAYAMTNLAERAAVGREIVNLAGSMEGGGRWVTEPKKRMKPTSFELSEIARSLEDAGLIEGYQPATGEAELPNGDLVDLDVAATIFRPDQRPRASDREISVWQNGKRQTWQIADDDLYRAMQSLDKPQMGTVGRIISATLRPISTLKRALITLSPEFGVSNTVKDQFTAWAQNGHSPFYGWIKNAAHALGQDETWKDWQRSGGGFSTMGDLDFRALEKKRADVLSGKTRIGKIVTHPLQMLHLMSEVSEEPTRIAAFKYRMENPLAADASGRAKRTRAAVESREATTDFGRSGAAMGALRSVTAFLNPSLQGLDKFVRTAKESPLRVAGVGAVMAATSFGLRHAIESDPEKKKIFSRVPMWQRNLFHIVITHHGDKPLSADDPTTFTVWKVPKPFEWGFVFHTLFERAVLDPLYAKHSAEDVAKSVWGASSQMLGFNVIPDAALPFIENVANHSFFSDRPIVPRGLEDLPPEMQYTERTSAIAKKLGQVSGWSPLKWDHLLHLGTLSQYGIDGIGAVMRWTGQTDKRIEPATPTLADKAFFRRFVSRYPASDAQPVEDFYDFYGKSQEAVNGLKRYLRDRDEEGAKKFEASNPILRDEPYAVNVLAEKLAHRFALGRKQARQIRASDMTPDEKRSQQDALYIEMIRQAEEFNAARAELKGKK